MMGPVWVGFGLVGGAIGFYVGYLAGQQAAYHVMVRVARRFLS